jgi:hypothetical protein
MVLAEVGLSDLIWTSVEHRQERARVDEYVYSTVAAGGGPVEEFARLAALHASGALTDEEFATIKERVVHGGMVAG